MKDGYTNDPNDLAKNTYRKIQCFFHFKNVLTFVSVYILSNSDPLTDVFILTSFSNILRNLAARNKVRFIG